MTTKGRSEMVSLIFSKKGDIDMPQKKSKYYYNGPVYYIDKYTGNWSGETWATSDKKALSNLSYRYKTDHNLKPGTLIRLDDDYLRETTAIDGDG